MQITLIDSCLRDYDGHHFEYARSVLDECRRRGWTAHAAIHRDAPPELAARLAAAPVLHHDIYSITAGRLGRVFGGLFLNLIVIARGCLRYWRDLGRIPREILSRTDLIFFHTVNDRQLPAIALWFLLRAPSRIRSLVILLRYRTGVKPLPRLAYRLAFRLLRLSRREVRLASDTELLTEDYARLSGMPVALYPIPHMPDSRGDAAARPRKGPLVLLLPGHTSLAKGLDIVADAAAAWPDDLADVRLRLQVSSWFSGDERVVSSRVAALRALPLVEMVEGSPDTATFHAWLRDADAILAPYNPAEYGGQTSGIFAEAAALGKPVITTRGTWMARQVERGLAAGEVLHEYSAAAFLAAVRRLRADLPRHQAAATAAAAAWRAFHQPSVFVDRLAGSPPA